MKKRKSKSNKKLNKKAQLQMSFQWIFAIIVGVFILALAIYGVTKALSTEPEIAGAKTGKEIGALLNPLETGFETGKTTLLTMPVETRIHALCDEFGAFGSQKIQISQRSFNRWSETGLDVSFENKYIFSENPAEGKNFYLFSKPFEFPFKVADLIYITPADENYCFINPPEEIREEISDLKQKNLFTERKDCPAKSTNICFSLATGCDLYVDYAQGYVEKNNQRLYFETDALMYGAVFSEPAIYECQLNRVVQRLENLALLYRDKSRLISRQGCTARLDSNLITLSNLAKSFENSQDLKAMKNMAEELENKNRLADCRLW